MNKLKAGRKKAQQSLDSVDNYSGEKPRNEIEIQDMNWQSRIQCPLASEEGILLTTKGHKSLHFPKK